MKRLLLLAVILFIFASAINAQVFSVKEFSPLHSLAGLWKMETKGGPVYEEWWKTASDKLSGRSYKVNKADTILFERLQLTLKGSDIYYIPTVSGQNNNQPVPFRLASYKGTRYVFENKEHDYPQRIIYVLVSKDSLHARIEGSRNGKEMRSDYFYSRAH